MKPSFAAAHGFLASALSANAAPAVSLGSATLAPSTVAQVRTLLAGGASVTDAIRTKRLASSRRCRRCESTRDLPRCGIVLF